MPLAGDAYLKGQLPAPNNPLNRLQLGTFPTTIDPAQFLAMWTQWVEQYLFPIIEDLTGIDLSAFLPTLEAVVDALTTLFGDLNPLSGTFNPLDAVTTFIELMVSVGANLPMALISELTGFSGGIPILSQLIGLFTGGASGLTGLGGLGAIFGDLTGLLGNPSGLGSGLPGLPGAAGIPLLGGLLGGLVNGGQPLNVLNLFGQLPTSLFGLIPASSIGGQTPNLLNNAGFDGSISMDGSGVWTWDAAVGHTSTGSARATADGTLKALLSNAVTVAQGQVVTPSVWTKTASYAGTGTPIRLAVRTYLNGAQVGTTNIQSIAGPGSTWTQLTGSYTVPSGVDQVRLRLVVDTTATAGSVWFDDATLTKPGNGPFDGILQLFNLSALTDLTGGLNVNAIWTAIINTIINPLGLLGQLSGGKLLDSQTPLGIVNLLSNLSTIFGGATGLTTTPGSFDPVTSGVQVLDQFLPGLGSLMNGLFGGFTGITSTGATQTNVQTATASQADAVAGQGSLITQIQAALGAGTPDSDDFERASLGSNWTFVASTGTGTIPDSHNFHFSGTGTAEYVMRKNNIAGSTDHITSTVVLNQAIPTWLITIPPYGGYIDVWVRMTAFTTYGTRTGVRLRVNSTSLAGGWSLDWVNSGTVTNLTSGSCAIPAAGSIIALEGGASATPRRYLGTLNGTPFCDFVDSGLVTTIGSSNRYRGFGARGNTGLGPAVGTPDIRQWTAQG